jgi:hypothetical protein
MHAIRPPSARSSVRRSRRTSLADFRKRHVKLLVMRGHSAHPLLVEFRKVEVNPPHSEVSCLQRGGPLLRRSLPIVAQVTLHGVTADTFQAARPARVAWAKLSTLSTGRESQFLAPGAVDGMSAFHPNLTKLQISTASCLEINLCLKILSRIAPVRLHYSQTMREASL